MECDKNAATEKFDTKVLKKYARYKPMMIDEWLTEEVKDVAIRYRTHGAALHEDSTVHCTQHSTES